MAERLDDVLGAGGALATLVPASPSPPWQGEVAQPSPWVYEFGRDISVATRREFTTAFLATLGVAVSARRLVGGPHVGRPHVELVESVLGELERTDAREGGDLVCDGAAAPLDTVYDWIYAGSYYQETLLLARMNDDRPLEARVLSYMCLQAQRRGWPRQATAWRRRRLGCHLAGPRRDWLRSCTCGWPAPSLAPRTLRVSGGSSPAPRMSLATARAPGTRRGSGR
jgi:hypothetical protein